MEKINNHIIVLRVSKKRTTSQGAKELSKVLNALRENYSDVEEFTINSMLDLEILSNKTPDLVFVGASPKRITLYENGQSNTVWLSKFLEDNSLAFTGSNINAILLDSYKSNAKMAIQNAGIKTADYFSAKPNQYSSTDTLPIEYPLFIKPPNSGGGKGIDKYSVVHNFNDFEQKILSVATVFKTDSLVEEYLHGREFTVAILTNYVTDTMMAMPVEIITEKNSRGDRIVGSNVKKNDKEKVQAIEDSILRQSLSDFAVNSFRALNAKDYGRIDIRMDKSGTLHFLEANLRPGLGGGYFTRACWINQKIPYNDVISNIVSLALNKKAKPSYF